MALMDAPNNKTRKSMHEVHRIYSEVHIDSLLKNDCCCRLSHRYTKIAKEALVHQIYNMTLKYGFITV